MRRLTALIMLMLCLAGCGAGLASSSAVAVGQVAFIRDGNLWVQMVAAGQPRRLTEGGGYDHPAWSPSGEWLAVRRASGYVTIRADGSVSHSLQELMQAAWAPDRDELAYLDAEGRIGAVRPDGSEGRALVTPGAAGPLGPPAWSPDGGRLAFTAGPGEGPTTPLAQVATVEAGGGAVAEAVSVRRSPAVCFSLAGWSPDGRWILSWQQDPCSPSLQAAGSPLMAAEARGTGGGKSRQLVERMLPYPEFVAGSAAADLLAVVDGAGRVAWTHKQVLLVDPATGRQTPVSRAGMAAVDPAWAPDGRQLAFVVGPATGAEFSGRAEEREALSARRIWVAAAPDWRPVQLTQDPRYQDESPHFTGDGQRILFARLDAQNRASLWLTRFEEADSITEIDAPPGAPTGHLGHLDWAAVFAYRP
jgi:Tol biopolymer transport system component